MVCLAAAVDASGAPQPAICIVSRNHTRCRILLPALFRTCPAISRAGKQPIIRRAGTTGGHTVAGWRAQALTWRRAARIGRPPAQAQRLSQSHWLHQRHHARVLTRLTWRTLRRLSYEILASSASLAMVPSNTCDGTRRRSKSAGDEGDERAILISNTNFTYPKKNIKMQLSSYYIVHF